MSRRAARGLAGALLLLGAVAQAPGASAQVTSDERALDQLGPAHPHRPAPHEAPRAAPHRAARAPAAHGTGGRAAPAHAVPATAGHGAQPHAHGRAAPATRSARTPVMPLHPPPPPVIAPPAVRVVLHPPPLPPPLPIDPKAPGTARAIPGGTEITFGGGGAGLNPATDAAILAIAQAAKADPALVVMIDAYAGGVPEDPSTPRRLSLARALAARAVLINAGVPSTRIYARALGAPPSPPLGSLQPAPADRADLTIRTTGDQDRITQAPEAAATVAPGSGPAAPAVGAQPPAAGNASGAAAAGDAGTAPTGDPRPAPPAGDAMPAPPAADAMPAPPAGGAGPAGRSGGAAAAPPPR